MKDTEESDTVADNAPFMQVRDIPLAILFLPFALIFGIHIAGLAMLIRKWTRIPYLLTMFTLYTLLLIPFWIPGPKFHFWPSLAGSLLTLACLVLPIAMGGRDEIMDGCNFEASAPAHIVLILVYLTVPAIHAAIKANGG